MEFSVTSMIVVSISTFPPLSVILFTKDIGIYVSLIFIMFYYNFIMWDMVPESMIKVLLP